MIFTKDLLVKGVAGLSVCAAAVGTGYHFRSEIRELIKGNNWTPEGIKKALGITAENCNLPTETASPTTCDSITAEKLKAINFEGKTDSLPSIDADKKAKLTITKLTNQEADFPLNYKFVLEPSATEGGRITIPGPLYINTGGRVELKIKKASDGLSLERFWNISKLTEKVGLEGCATVNANGTECTIKTAEGSGLNVKHSDSEKGKKTKSTTASSTGKIKVYSGTAAEGYNEGFKFVIEEGDITLNNGAPNKLEEFETYEIKESEGEYYLTRKEKSSEAKKRLLNLPCDLPVDNNEKNCENITVDQLKAINFENKGTEDLTVANGDTPTLKLKISKTTEANKVDYPLGYKFILESNKDITIPGTSPTTFKADTNTELKIKKSADHRTLTLGKAWTLSTLAAKVGLNCPSTGNTNQECTLNETGINVKNSDSNKYSGLTRGAGNENKKVKYEVDKADFNQGFKFYTEESQGITLQDSTAGTGSDPNASNKKIEHKGTSNNVFYEIKKDTDGTWYLTKKSAA